MSSAQAGQADQSEAQVAEAVVARYRAMGFEVEQPGPATRLPPFFGNYRPDLIVHMPDEPDRKIAVEVLQAGGGRRGLKLEDLKQRFEGQKGWEFRIALAPPDPEATLRLPIATRPQLEAELDAVERLAAEVGTRPAFVMAWALLEAVSHAVPEGSTLRPRKPMTTTRTLGALGLIEPEEEDKLNALVSLRNGIVHGAITSVPSQADVATLTTAIRRVLEAL